MTNVHTLKQTLGEFYNKVKIRDQDPEIKTWAGFKSQMLEQLSYTGALTLSEFKNFIFWLWSQADSS